EEHRERPRAFGLVDARHELSPGCGAAKRHVGDLERELRRRVVSNPGGGRAAGEAGGAQCGDGFQKLPPSGHGGPPAAILCSRLLTGEDGMTILRFFLVAALSFSAHAQVYPSKPVKIVVATGAGTVDDLPARIVAEKLSQ